MSQARITQYKKIQKLVESEQTTLNRAEGNLDSLKQQLVDEFNCHSPKEATELLDKLEADEGRLEKQYQKGLESFTSKWGDRL